jgi:hypothetical protein
MTSRVAILEEADREEKSAAREGRGRFGPLVLEFRRRGVDADTVFYRDEDAAAVEHELQGWSAVLVFVNPVHNGRGRAVLNPLLERLCPRVFVSAAPAVIEKIGTKAVLVETQHLSWSTGDVHLLQPGEDFGPALTERLSGGPRVLKQVAGNGGGQVWRMTLQPEGGGGEPQVHLLRASGGGAGEVLPLSQAIAVVTEGGGAVVDQPFHRPGPDGMVRCYLTHGTAVGFGHQIVGQLTAGPGEEPITSTPRRYFPADDARFDTLRRRMDDEWVPQMCAALGITARDLPVIWDADFFWWRDPHGGERFELCEINASCVHPYPDSAIPAMVDATLERIGRKP